MDFEDTKEEAEFRAKAIAFLDSHRERKADVEHTMSSADDRVAMLQEAKEWQIQKHDAGFTGH